MFGPDCLMCAIFGLDCLVCAMFTRSYLPRLHAIEVLPLVHAPVRPRVEPVPAVEESVDKAVLQKSISARICQLILHISIFKEQVYGSVRELTFAKTTL